MSEKLDVLVDNYLKSQDKNVFQKGVKESDRQIYISAAKQKIKDEIYEEIKAEVRDDAVSEAQTIIEEKAGLKRIDEFKKLAIDGFLVAVFVGLFVNQATDFIGYYKGSVSLQSVWSTVILAFLFISICVGIFGWRFISELIRLLNQRK